MTPEGVPSLSGLPHSGEKKCMVEKKERKCKNDPAITSDDFCHRAHAGRSLTSVEETI